MTKPRVLAYPSLIKGPYQGGDWTVQEVPVIQSHTAPAERLLAVPRPTLAEDVLAIQHEHWHIVRAAVVGRAVWRDPSLRGSVRRTLEEPAIDSAALAAGMDIRAARDHLDWDAMPVPGAMPMLVDRYIRLVMGVETGGAQNPAIAEYLETVAARIREQAPDLLALAYDAARSVWSDPSPTNCDTWTDRVASHPKLARADPRDIPPPSRDGSECAHHSHGSLPGESPDAQSERRAAQADQHATDQDAQHAAENAGAGDQLSETIRDQVEHGRVTVHRHITSRMSRAPLSSGWYASESGSTVRFPRGLVPNGRIFGMRAKGGSILIDLSASMDWDHAELARAVAALPGLWCAGYSAPRERYAESDRGSRGRRPSAAFLAAPAARICILARDGRIGDYEREREHSYINNYQGCDAPALEYAIKRAPRPLVWVADGNVGDVADSELCSRIMRRNGIVRVLTLTDAIAYLAGKSVRAHRTCHAETLTPPYAHR